jgi:hypothetical protein
LIEIGFGAPLASAAGTKLIDRLLVDSTAETIDGLRLLAREDQAGKRILPTHDATVFRLYPDGVR